MTRKCDDMESYIRKALEQYERKRRGGQPFILRNQGISQYQKEVCREIQKRHPTATTFKSDWLGYVVYETEEQKTTIRKMLAEALRYRRKLLYQLMDEFIELLD